MMADADVAAARLDDLKALGVRIAMDDFGTGYSSLSYLSRFPVDVIKMDRSFLRPEASPEAVDLSSAVVALGSSLALEVVAEGIELDAQLKRLRELGCELGQGFHFAHPMESERMLDYLADNSAQATQTGVGSASLGAAGQPNGGPAPASPDAS
jgi:EAL domain-containing protein (putative c-di-GMP-specific phosphodiesterase class I)